MQKKQKIKAKRLLRRLAGQRFPKSLLQYKQPVKYSVVERHFYKRAVCK
jgi:hypothetical protein